MRVVGGRRKGATFYEYILKVIPNVSDGPLDMEHSYYRFIFSFKTWSEKKKDYMQCIH